MQEPNPHSLGIMTAPTINDTSPGHLIYYRLATIASQGDYARWRCPIAGRSRADFLRAMSSNSWDILRCVIMNWG